MVSRISSSWFCGRLRFVSSVAVVLLALPSLLFAQATISTGNIQGTVIDPSGALLAGAKITVVSPETGQTSILTTTSAGFYASGALHPGPYVVKVESPGFKTVELTLVVQVGVTSSGNVRLQLGAATEVVQVQSSSVSVNTDQAAIQGVLTTQQIETLPINGRNFIDLAQLEPGVQTQDVGKLDGRLGHAGISVGGRYSESTRVEVDGLDMSDDTGSTLASFSTSAIQEFSLSQSTQDLSSESTNSGSVNIVTRTGTNALHGEGLYLFRDRSLSANFNEGLHPPYQRHDFAGNLGGPVIKDKLFFFVNGERFKQDLGNPFIVLPPLNIGSAVINQPLRQSLLEGRLDYNIPKGTLFYRFAYDNTKAVGDPPTTDRLVDNTPSHAVGINLSTGRYTHGIRFGYAKNVELLQSAPQPGMYNPLPQVTIDINDFGSGPNVNAPQTTYRDRKQIKYDGTRIFTAHLLRYGFSYTRIMSLRAQNYNGAGPSVNSQVTPDTETFANNSCGTNTPCFAGGQSNPLNYPIQTFGVGNGQGFSTEIPGFGLPAGANLPDNRIEWYVGDSWRVKPNFTLTYGLHYIRDTGITASDIAPIPCSAINPALEPIPCNGNLLDMFGPGLGARPSVPSRNFAPQVGIVWDVRNNGKTVLRAGASKVYSASSNASFLGRPQLLSQGLFNATQTVCPSGNLTFPTSGGGTQTISSVNGLDIASQVCGAPIGNVAGDIVALQQQYQAATIAAGPQSNPLFVGNALAISGNLPGLDAPNYRTPYSYQMNVGVQHEIRRGTVLSADYVRNVSLHYPMVIDANHVGDARYLNKNAANNAINLTNESFGCPDGIGGINCSIANGASIEDFAGYGLTSTTDFTFLPPSLAGLTPDTAAAFPGINPNVFEGLFNYPIGRAMYQALQVSLKQQAVHPLPFTKSMYLQVSHNLSRYLSPLAYDAGDDQDGRTVGNNLSQNGATGAKDYRNPLSHFGPTAFDRTHQFSVGTTIDFVKPLRVGLIGHVYSPLSQSMVVLDQFRFGEIFHTDFGGDGTTGDLLPGTTVGAFGRSVKAGDLTAVLEKYNNTVAGTILPAGQSLINAGLFTKDQLIALGAVADRVPLGPNDPTPLNNRAGLGWLKTVDLKISAPIKLGERVTIEPSAAAYNLFNFANFNIDPGQRPSSALRGTPNSVNGTANVMSQLNRFRASQGPSLFSLGTARQFEFGIKLSF